MTIINHTVEQIASGDHFTVFEGLTGIRLTITLPEWHKPFEIQERMGAENPRELEMVGLCSVAQSWYINGPVMDQWTISTLMGSIKVPAGTRIVSEELPEKWEANREEASQGKKQWWAYTNGRNDFC